MLQACLELNFQLFQGRACLPWGRANETYLWGGQVPSGESKYSVGESTGRTNENIITTRFHLVFHLVYMVKRNFAYFVTGEVTGAELRGEGNGDRGSPEQLQPLSIKSEI